jgi:uncharacterized protein YndB with AHSA1/START domain
MLDSPKSPGPGEPLPTDVKYVYGTLIQASLPQVWETLTEVGSVLPFFFMTRLEGLLLPGGQIRFVMSEQEHALFEGEVLEVIPPRRLSFTFSIQGYSDPPSRVTIELTAQSPEETYVEVLHDRFGGTTRTFRSMSHAWPLVFGNLRSLMETGGPAPTAHGAAILANFFVPFAARQRRRPAQAG